MVGIDRLIYIGGMLEETTIALNTTICLSSGQ